MPLLSSSSTVKCSKTARIFLEQNIGCRCHCVVVFSIVAGVTLLPTLSTAARLRQAALFCEFLASSDSRAWKYFTPLNTSAYGDRSTASMQLFPPLQPNLFSEAFAAPAAERSLQNARGRDIVIVWTPSHVD